MLKVIRYNNCNNNCCLYNDNIEAAHFGQTTSRVPTFSHSALEAIKAASLFEHLLSHNCDSSAIYLIPVSSYYKCHYLTPITS